MATWALTKKEFRLIVRDRLSAGILLLMPLFCILVLGLLLGEGFGQKTDNRLRVSIVDLDEGYPHHCIRECAAGLAATPMMPCAGLSALQVHHLEPWSKIVQRDLEESDIRVELIGSVEEAQQLVDSGRRAAVFILGPKFSERILVCSFLADGINPFFRDGVDIKALDARLLKDPTQTTASAIIDQVGQVTLLRVILPWMIGRAFERLSEPSFIDILGNQVKLPVPKQFEFILTQLRKPRPVFVIRECAGQLAITPCSAFGSLPAAVAQAQSIQLAAREAGKVDPERISLQEMLDIAAGQNKSAAELYRQKVGSGVQQALAAQFPKYNLTGKTWAALTKSDPREGRGSEAVKFTDEAGKGFLNRGAARYQILVPAYTVLFSFALILTVGWLFVTERRQGTLKRLRAAPVTHGAILLGKLLPCLALSAFQGFFLLGAGKLVFNMSWGPDSWSLGRQTLMLAPVVLSTSLAAMGLAMVVAALARTEMQVAIIGSLLFLFLGLISGCLIPRELMPEGMTQVSHVTPHAWALDAYRQLLQRPAPGAEIVPNLEVVRDSCLILSAYGVGFIALAWGLLRLDAK